MTPEAIAAIFTGLTGLIAALAAFTATRSRRLTQDQRVLRRRVRLLERQTLVLVEHVFRLELEVARNGGKVPERPLILEQLDADELDDPDASTTPGKRAEGDGPVAGGRHAIRR